MGIKNDMKTFATGEIVRWGDSLWIVSESRKDKLVLLSMNRANCSAYISENWPIKKSDRQVKWVANSVYDFITRTLKNVGK